MGKVFLSENFVYLDDITHFQEPMSKLKPINLDNGVIRIHPLRISDIERENEIIESLFEILSDEENTKFIPEKRANDIKQISMNMLGVTFRYTQELGYTHFISLKESKEVIGQINIITPKGIEFESEYGIKDNWFIEYFLKKKYWGYGIMGGILTAVVLEMKKQGITNVCAVCYRENIASIKTLEKSGFIRVSEFDLKQDLYKLK
jgi:RimJ/RimL family protein N-acetyltransferase